MIYCFGGYELDTQLFTLRHDGEMLRMRPKAFLILSYLIEHRDRVIEKQELAEQIWPDQVISGSTLENAIRAVRRTLGDSGREQRFIKTHYGHGYHFVADITQQAESGKEESLSGTEETTDLQPDTASSELKAATPLERPESIAAEESWQCMACKQVNPAHQAGESRFCIACGAPRRTACPQCGIDILPGSRFCAQCGTALAESPASTLPSPPALEPSVSPSLASGMNPPDFERRQLTVLFCDVVNSTALSNRMELEDYLDMIRAYHDACAEVVERLDGHIAQYLGDGLLIYFGYPLAHEDDAQRAIRAGLGIIEALQPLKTRLAQEAGIQLAVRLGLHTGAVIVGDVNAEERREALALGETPNIAARLQDLAEPDTLLISHATYRLVQGYFICEDLGLHALKGIPSSLQLFRVVSPTGAKSRLDAAFPDGLTPMVDRETELTLLLEHWEQVKGGMGRVIVLMGEGGIGKSRLAQALRDRLSGEAYTQLECWCSPYYQNSAWHPVIELYHRLCDWQTEDPPAARFEKLETALTQFSLPLAATLPLMATFLGCPYPHDRYPASMATPQQQRNQILDIMLTMLVQLSAEQPVLFLVEDLHWADPSTLEFVTRLVEQTATEHLCIVCTCRPAYRPPWGLRSYVTEIALGRLPQHDVEEMVAGVTRGKRLSAEVLEQIVDKTDGVPLFVEELTKTLLEMALPQETEAQYESVAPLYDMMIPATLHDSLMARLDRLDTAKSVAQLGATLGRQFPYDLLRAVSPWDESVLQQELQRLVDAELVFQRGVSPQATYSFKHSLIQDAAYQSLVRPTRQHYHQRIAEVLSEQFPSICDARPEILAHHYTEAGLVEPAIYWWHQAGKRAVERSANAEAINHLTRGLELLELLPDTPERHQQELDVQLTLGTPLMMVKGYSASEVERVYTRARELCQQVGDSPRLFAVLSGLKRFYINRAEFNASLELGEQHLQLAHRLQDTTAMLVAHMGLGTATFHLGEFVTARSHLERGIALYDPEHYAAQVFDPLIMCHCYAARTLWYLGYPDQAQARSKEALRLARQLSQPYTLGSALHIISMFHKERREPALVQEYAEVELALGHEHGFMRWVSGGLVRKGWALAEQGEAAAGIAQLQQGLDMWRESGKLGLPQHLAMLVEAYRCAGRLEDGLQLLDEALAAVRDSTERQYEAELHRLRGELLLQTGHSRSLHQEAEEHFLRGLHVARQQQAKSLELRTATGLSRLWQQQGKQTEARQLLFGLYDWFTEGFDTPDIQEAQSLLNTLK